MCYPCLRSELLPMSPVAQGGGAREFESRGPGPLTRRAARADLSPPEGFAQLISDDSIVTNDSGDLEMVERVVGQLGLADGLVSAPAAQMLDELDAALDWGRLRALLGKRGGTGPGRSEERRVGSEWGS